MACPFCGHTNGSAPRLSRLTIGVDVVPRLLVPVLVIILPMTGPSSWTICQACLSGILRAAQERP